MSRQIILDTETTGLDPKTGDRIVEIGGVEMIDRQLTGNNFHVYINPERDMPIGAFNVHGLSEEFLSDKPLFSEIARDFVTFIGNDELIIHNASFDLSFLDYELNRINLSTLTGRIPVIDTLAMARDLYPGQRNSLDALCRRLSIDNSNRTLHGALLDSEILAQVYLAMTGGQEALLFSEPEKSGNNKQTNLVNTDTHVKHALKTRVVYANPHELDAHTVFMSKINGNL